MRSNQAGYCASIIATIALAALSGFGAYEGSTELMHEHSARLEDESVAIACLNGRAFITDDGSLVNCGDVRTVKYKLIGGV